MARRNTELTHLAGSYHKLGLTVKHGGFGTDDIDADGGHGAGAPKLVFGVAGLRRPVSVCGRVKRKT